MAVSQVCVSRGLESGAGWDPARYCSGVWLSSPPYFTVKCQCQLGSFILWTFWVFKVGFRYNPEPTPGLRLAFSSAVCLEGQNSPLVTFFPFLISPFCILSMKSAYPSKFTKIFSCICF